MPMYYCERSVLCVSNPLGFYDPVHAGAWNGENDVQAFDLLLCLEYPKRRVPSFMTENL